MSIHYHQQQLCVEQVSLPILAASVPTPCYVYSRAEMSARFLEYQQALCEHEHLICYAVKAASNIAILNILARLGAGFDIVSGGELARVIEAGGDPKKVVFSGVGKTADELAYALKMGIKCFNVESIPELERLNQIAASLNVVAPISLRVNPDVDAKTHPYIATGLRENKFGIASKDVIPTYQLAAKMAHIQIVGMDCHIGSQLCDSAPYAEAVARLGAMLRALQDIGIRFAHLDFGGGLGIRYSDETPPSIGDFITTLTQNLDAQGLDYQPMLIVEPGRSIIGNAGLLLTKVEYIKTGSDKNFAIVDAAMTEMLRPSLYSAYMRIVPVQEHSQATARIYDIVGAVCETGDWLGKDRELAIQAGDYLAMLGAGAYGFSMSSTYNSRNRCAEVMVDGDEFHLIRERETFAMQIAGEQLLP